MDNDKEPSAASLREAEDREALVVIHRSTGPWARRRFGKRQNWDTDEHFGLWYGVEVNSQKRVERLELGAICLRGSLPAELGRLSALQVLLVSNNLLKGPIPPELGNLPALTTLSMWNNELTGPIPGEFGSLKSLTWLDLSNNQLCGPIPPQLGDLWNLKHLNLSLNPLSGGEIPKRLMDHRFFRKFIVGRAMDGPPLPHVDGAGHAVKILIVPVVLGYLDVISDIYTAVSYYKSDHLFWFVLVIAFALGPAVIVSAFFLREFSFGRRFLVATQLSLLLEAVFSAASATYSPVLALVRVIEPLFEAIPQLLLQMYAMLLLWSETSLSNSDLNGRVVSVCISAVSLAYAATDVSSVERLLNSRILGEGGTARIRMCPGCPSLTGVIFSRVPENGVSRLVGMGWVHPRSHVWFCFLYHVLEIVSRFVPLAMVALVVRKWFFLVLPYLWISRCLIVWAVDYSGEAMDFRFRVRFVAMPFIDSILDGTRAYGLGLALTLVEFIACMVVYHLFTNDHLPMNVRCTLTVISSCCMVGKIRLALLAIFPLKENGYGSQRQGGAAAQGGAVADGGDTDQHATGATVPGFGKGEANVDELETAECGIQACSPEAIPSQSATTSASAEDAKEEVSPPASIPPTAPVREPLKHQVSSDVVAIAPPLIAGAVGIALATDGIIHSSERHRGQETIRSGTRFRAGTATGGERAPSSGSVATTPSARETPCSYTGQQQEQGQQHQQHKSGMEEGGNRPAGDGADPLAHAAEPLHPGDALLVHQVAYPSTMLPTAPVVDSSLGTVLRHGIVQPFLAAVPAVGGGPQPMGNNMPATQHAWYGAGVVGMSPYTQGMLPLGVGGAAGVFQYMGSTGEGWRVFPLAAQYSTHGAPQAGYTLAASSPPWDVAAGRLRSRPAVALQNAFPLRTLVMMVAAWEKKVVVGDRASPGKDIYRAHT